MKKKLKISGIILAVIMTLFGAFLCWWFLFDSYTDFYSNSTKGFEIPGLKEGFIPQGLCYIEQDNSYLVSGYMNDGSASRIYVVTNNKTEKYFTLKNIDNSHYTGHAGGIDTDGLSVWVAGDKMVYRFEYSQVAMVQNGHEIAINDCFEASNGADFVTVENDVLWIGEFHHAEKYKTDEKHHIETKSGETNHAITFGYQIDFGSNGGVKSTVPTKAISMPSYVQGIAFDSEKIILSTSWSLPNSTIYTYEIDNISVEQYEYSDGVFIDMLVLDKSYIKSSKSIPSMSEEIDVVDGKLCILFENACAKYKLFTREKLYNVYFMTI